VYEGTDLEALIQQVLDEHGPAKIRPPERRRKGGFLGFFTREVYTIEVDAGDGPSGAAVAGVSGWEGLLTSTEDEVELSSGGPVAGADAAPAPPPAAVGPAKSFDEVLTDVASSLGEEPGTYRPDPTTLRRMRGGGAGQRPAASPLPPVAERPGRPAKWAAIQAGLLEMVGFPASLLPAPLAGLTGDHAVGLFEAAFGSLPPARPLPRTPGSLVALVGDPRAAARLARTVAAELAVPPKDIAVAAPDGNAGAGRPGLRVRTVEEATDRSGDWRRDRVGIVVVHAPPPGGDQQWARAMLRALRPSCVWGLVSATTKIEDVARWADDLGGLDALAVGEVGHTMTPAAVVATGIPVARLDGQPATPPRWAAVVAELAARR